jgi:erythromycin esterase-like protein
MTPGCLPGGELTFAQIEALGVTPDDIDSNWMDDMVKRLFKELKRQLSQIESIKPENDEVKRAAVRVANVRALSALERTLERLARMEQQRVASRKVRTAARNEEIRITLERRIDRLVIYSATQHVPEKSER